MLQDSSRRLTVRETAGAIKKNELRPSEAVETALTKITQKDKELNAFITVSAERARERAKDIEINWAQYKNSPLAGVPIAIKDNLLWKGTRLTCGSKMLQDFVAPYSATVVERLEAAGAIILGKLNMDEFAMGSSNEHSAFGAVKNPWDPTRVPGGSSGGSACAVAAGYVPATLGSDTGGSIRQPAAFCGLVGLKPTYGRVSRYGLVAFASSLDQIGPLTQTVDDTALILETMAGKDAKDATSSVAPVPPYVAELDAEKKKGFQARTLGVPYKLLEVGLDAEVRTQVESAIQHFKKLGYKIESIELPHAQYAIAIYYVVATSEASSNLSRFDGVRYTSRAKDTATIHDVYRKTRTEFFGREVKFRILLGNFCLASGYYDAYYMKAQKARALLAQDFDQAFKKCDVILTPTTPETPFRFGEKTADPLKMYLSDIYTVSMNLTGVAAMSLPCGWTKQKLPVGLQLIAPRFGEQKLFSVGQHFQDTTDHHRRSV